MVMRQTFESREEWLKGRTTIGGSDAACILGMNPWKSNVELWEEKVGRRKAPDISGKGVVRYGIDAEPLLRELFKLDFPQMEVMYEEHNLWVNDRFPWAHASLDGWLYDLKNEVYGVLEIKTTEIVNSTQLGKWNNRIPDNYYCQVLFCLAVTEFDFAIVKAQLKSTYDGMPSLQTRHYRIDRADVEDEIKYLMDAGEEFDRYIKNGIRPPLKLPSM